MEAEKIMVMVREPDNYWEALRTALGLAVEMIETHVFVLGQVHISEDRVEGFKENLEFLIDDLEGEAYTDSLENVEKWGYFEYLSVEDAARSLDEYNLIIPF